MPRQIDLFPQNLQVNNDPTNRLGVTSAQINKLNGEIPAKIAAAQAQAVTGFLTLLDQETGLDLLGLWNDYQSLVSFIEAGLTTSFNGIEAALQTLVNNASNAWTQIEDFLLTGDWADLSAAWTDIFGTAQEAEANWQTLFTELGFSVSTATQLADFLSGVSNTASNALTPSSSLNASNLWGLIPTQVVGSVASTAVVDVSPNPLLNPNFESAISVSPGSGWVWDSTVYFTPPGGDTAPGSAKVTADGVLHALRSNLIPVASGQSLSVSLPVLASGMVSTGTPLALHVITFNGNTQTGITTVTAIANPAGASTGWVNPPSGSKGGTLSGTYVVASGVTQVQLRLVVDTTASAGSVWFGNATASLSGGLIANLQSDLSTLQSDSAASTAVFSTFMSSIQSAITGYTSWSSFIAAMESAWITYSTTESGLLSSEVATLQQIINSLFGINTSTGLMAASNVSNVLGQGSLGDDVQAILDYIANALGHSGTGHTLTQIETYLGLIPAANLPTGVQSANTYWSTLMTNLFGASTPASTVQSTALPTAVQSANTYWSTLMTNLFGGSTPASTIKVGAVPTGVPATNIANVLGGANLGADVSSVHSTAVNGTTWATRIINDVTVLLDVFHLTYTSTQYNNAWTDFLALFGIVNSVTAPSNPTPTIGSSITSAQSAASGAQNTADTASGNANSALNQLVALPQQNVVPLAVETGQPAALVASGAGATNTGSGSVTASWADTIPSTANYLVIVANVATSNGGDANVLVAGASNTKYASAVSTVTYATNSKLILFGLANPPTGAVTIKVTARDGGSVVSLVAGTSMSFSNAVSLSSVSSTQANNANPSLSTGFTSGQLVVNAIGTFGTLGSAVGLSSYNRNQIYHAGNFSSSTFAMDLLAGTATGVNSPNFTANAASTTNEAFAALAVVVNAPPSILGSYARAYRSSSSGTTVSVSTTVAGHYAGLFDASLASDDITVDLSTGRMTVAYSGTYLFKVGLKFTGIFATQTMDGLCLVNGAVFEWSKQDWYSSSSQTRFVWSTQVFLNAGDYVEPGCVFGSTALITVAGDSTGSQTYMSLSLLNRSLL